MSTTPSPHPSNLVVQLNVFEVVRMLLVLALIASVVYVVYWLVKTIGWHLEQAGNAKAAQMMQQLQAEQDKGAEEEEGAPRGRGAGRFGAQQRRF